jgi:serine/threonine-protein kinase
MAPRGIKLLARFVGELSRRKVPRAAGAYLVMAFIVMQVVDDVFPYVPGLAADSAGTAVLLVLALGFPLTVTLAWVWEVTPQGVRRELSAEEATREAGARAALVKPLRRDSVAVLAFENLSADPDNEYFSDGITDDIIASVSRISGLHVLSRSAVMEFKGTGMRAIEIAGRLGVATVIDGSVRRSGSRVRIRVEAVDADSAELLWSETYDRELEDIFQVQSEVAASVARAVRHELSHANRRAIEASGTANAEAYDMYLRGRFHWNQRSETAVAKSVAYFEWAIEHDREFALAYAGLADANVILGIYGAQAPSEVMEAARRAATRALELQPTLGEASASLACVRAVFDWAWPAAEAGFREAFARAPSHATAHQWYAMSLLAPAARFAEARAELDLAEELDPRSVAIATSRGILSYYARDYVTALREQQSVVLQYPSFGLGHFFLGQIQVAAGSPEAALEPLRHAVDLSDESSETLAALAHALAMAGRLSDAEALLARLEQRAKQRYVSPALIAQVSLGLGDRDGALDRLEEAARIRASDLVWLAVRPVYDPLRMEPRFLALTERIGP